MKNKDHYSRRELIKGTAALLGLGLLGISWRPFSGSRTRNLNLSICDWSIAQQGQVEALEYASRIGLDGVQVSLGSVQDNMHLRQSVIQEKFHEAVKKSGVKISSMAIGELNNIPYKSAPEAEQWVSDCIDVAQELNCSVILLAFFNKGDLKGDPQGIQEVIRRLKKVAPKAQKAGVILGIESWLSAQEHLEIIRTVGSENVQVYYDVANATEMGYDIFEEIRLLGKEHICEVHLKENGSLLGQGKVDLVRVKKVLDEIGYQGWIVLEGAVPKGADLFDSYVSNANFVRSVFK